MPLCPLCAQCLVHADYRVRLWRLQWPAQYNIHSPDPAPTGHQPGAEWRGSVSYLKKGLSLSSHILPNWICFLNFRHPKAASVQGAGVLPAAGVSSSSSGRVLGCIVTWEKWSGIYWASLCRLCPATVQHWHQHQPAPFLTCFQFQRYKISWHSSLLLVLWICRYYVVHNIYSAVVTAWTRMK